MICPKCGVVRKGDNEFNMGDFDFVGDGNDYIFKIDSNDV